MGDMHEVESSPTDSLLRSYEQHKRSRGRAGSSLHTYRKYLVPFCTWLAETGRTPADITRLVDLDEWFSVWQERFVEKWGREPAQNTRCTHETALASFYDYLFRRELIEVNPMLKYDRTPPPSPKPNDWLAPDEFNAFIDAPISPQERIIVAVYAYTGARATEIIEGVLQGDVDFSPTNLLPDGRMRITESKTEAGVRVIPILPELRIELERWFRYLSEKGLRDDRLPLLVTKNRTPMSYKYTWRIIKKVAARAEVRAKDATDNAKQNVSHISGHTLRRTLGTHYANGLNGLPTVRAEVVKALLGHSNIQTTLKYYAELQQETVAAEILGVGERHGFSR